LQKDFYFFSELNPEPVIEATLEGKITYLNPAARKSYPRLLSEESHPILKKLAEVKDTLKEKKKVVKELKIKDKFLEIHFCYFSQVERVIICVWDISERKKAEEELRKFLHAVEQSSDWIVITDKRGRIEFVNKKVEEITGYKRKELIGKTPSVWKSDRHESNFYDNLWSTLLSGKAYRGVFADRNRKGELFYLEESITPVKDEKGDITHFISVGKDITKAKLLEEKVTYLTSYDVLTGLPNRELFMKDLENSIEIARKNNKLVAVMLVDVDKMERLNEAYGFVFGDEVLRGVAKRLSDISDKKFILGRLVSDEFALAIPNIRREQKVANILNKLQESFSLPLKIKGKEVKINLSIGVSLYPYDGADPDTLLRNARVTVNRVKEEGGNNFQFFTGEMGNTAAKFLSLYSALSHALSKKEFILYYQPYFEIETGKVKGMEALLRWKSKKRGIVSPVEFIPILEETGMIWEVGEWIIGEVCRKICQWRKEGFLNVPIFVNVSPVQFKREGFYEVLRRKVEECKLEKSFLGVEITESALMDNLDLTRDLLSQLKERGILISLDDFGTGYSSLAYLKKLPVDNLKIDITFIRGISDNPDDVSIVSAIILMAHALGLKTVAEGVEKEEQLKILRLLKCDVVQGYFYTPPLPERDVVKFLKKQESL